MTSGGKTVKTTLYSDSVQDSYAIWPEKLLKKENCSLHEEISTKRQWNWNTPKTVSCIIRCSCRTSLSRYKKGLIGNIKRTYTESALTTVDNSRHHVRAEVSWEIETAILRRLQSEPLGGPRSISMCKSSERSLIDGPLLQRYRRRRALLGSCWHHWHRPRSQEVLLSGSS